MKTMYEITWHYHQDDHLYDVTVTPITVLREGILPGCSAPSITAKGADGRKFQGSARDYFATEDAAWEQVRLDLLASKKAAEDAIRDLQGNLESLTLIIGQVRQRPTKHFNTNN